MSKSSAPTPAQIAERAYGLAIVRVRDWFVNGDTEEQDLVTHLESFKEHDLSDLRNSVVNPGAIPWWNK